MQHGVSHEYTFDMSFFESKDYAMLISLGETLDGLLEETAYFKRGERTFATTEFSQGLSWLMDQSKRGHYIQTL